MNEMGLLSTPVKNGMGPIVQSGKTGWDNRPPMSKMSLDQLSMGPIVYYHNTMVYNEADATIQQYLFFRP